ncbi:MAG: metalloregulator ArsR/SmtB family transcription factor [Candidatus Eremiobacteraeota bacterium]|nr:metalloregulator ArsR/SmtB family transcription factor [Candidatus Eremiobacteraeota bacterium]
MKTGTPRAKRRFKDDVYAALARVPAAIANPHRLELLELLGQRPRTVADVAGEAGLSIANASQHLQVLAKCGLVEVERHGTFAFYRTTSVTVYRLLQSLHEVANQHDRAIAEVFAKHLGDRDRGIEDWEKARALMRDPRVALLDARPAEEYAAGHLPKAINAPLEGLRSGKVSLPRSKRYIVYCRGPFCTFADDAVAILRERGFDATRLDLGPLEWQAAGRQLSNVG